MKFAAVAALFSLASAASMQKKQAQEYKIVDFVASCIPHSVYCSYDFKVDHDPVFEPDHCEAFVQGPDNLPSDPGWWSGFQDLVPVQLAF
ncbi:hypothetical protein DL767_003255 [Monosporascus sp. MG133]|nr:hypothetical protein DL767_003255 [Monosporascus sp. MG133]